MKTLYRLHHFGVWEMPLAVLIATTISISDANASTIETVTQVRAGSLEIFDFTEINRGSVVGVPNEDSKTSTKEEDLRLVFNNFDPTLGTLLRARWEFDVRASVLIETDSRCAAQLAIPGFSCDLENTTSAVLEVDYGGGTDDRSIVTSPFGIPDLLLIPGAGQNFSLPDMTADTEVDGSNTIGCAIAELFTGESTCSLSDNDVEIAATDFTDSFAVNTQKYIGEEVRAVLNAKVTSQLDTRCQVFGVIGACSTLTDATASAAIVATLHYDYLVPMVIPQDPVDPVNPVPVPPTLALGFAGLVALFGLKLTGRRRS